MILLLAVQLSYLVMLQPHLSALQQQTGLEGVWRGVARGEGGGVVKGSLMSPPAPEPYDPPVHPLPRPP